MKETFFPIILGLFLAYLLNPILKKLEKYLFLPCAEKIYKNNQKKQKTFARIFGVIGTMGIFVLLLTGAFYIVIPQIYTSIVKIIGELPSYYAEVEQWVLEFLEDNKDVSAVVLTTLDNCYAQLLGYVNTVILPNLDEIIKGITFGIVGGIKSMLNIFLAVIISIYVLFEKENLICYSKKICYAYFSRKHANALIFGVRYMNKVFGGFMSGMILDSFIVGVLCYIFLLLTRFEYAVLISILVGAANVIPYFGPIIGAVPSVFLLFVTQPKQGIIFGIFLLILQQIDGNIINPMILGGSLNLSGIWILISILIGGGLFGVVGMILGAPTFACIYAIFGNDTRKKLRRKKLPVESKEFLDIENITEDSQINYFKEK